MSPARETRSSRCSPRALAAGASPLEGARLANIAAGLVVMKLGTATITADELRTAIAGEAS